MLVTYRPLPSLVRMLLLTTTLILLGSAQARAQSTPAQTVDAFYRDYMTAVARTPRRWVQELVKKQEAHLDPDLAAWLVEIASNTPDSGKAWLDFDPIGNSQMGTLKYIVKAASQKGGETIVPVALQLTRGPGPPKVRVCVTLQKRAGAWIITNFNYPAEAGMKAWDLKTFLKTALKH